MRLILGTFFLCAAMMNAVLAVEAAPAERFGYVVLFAVIGALLLRSGARAREGWMSTLGITWMVFGALLLLAIPNLRQAASESGAALAALEGIPGLILGGALLLIMGGLLVLRGRRTAGSPS